MTAKRRFRSNAPQPYALGEGKLLPNQKRAAPVYRGPKPIRRSGVVDARIAGTCWVCKAPITKGTLVCKAEFPNGKSRWVHAGCSRDVNA